MNKGFTLIELLIVCAIILALVSFSTPLFRRTVADLELRETAANISKVIALTQQKAIIERTTCKITFDFENRTYKFDKLFSVPRGIGIKGKSAEILFYPDGHSDKVELELTNANKKQLKICTTGILGNVEIREE